MLTQKKWILLLWLSICTGVSGGDFIRAEIRQKHNDTWLELNKYGIKESVHRTDTSTVAQKLSIFKQKAKNKVFVEKLKDYNKTNGKSLQVFSPRYNGVPFQIAEAKNYMTGPGDSVVPFNGELIISENDLNLQERGGIGFSFSRTYSSFNKSDIGCGIGWRHNYDMWISRQPEEIFLHLNNRVVKFSLKDKKWISGKGDFYDLQKEKDGSIFIFTGDLTRYRFEKSDEPGSNILRLAEIASRHGNWSKNTLKIHYLANSNRIDFIIDPFENKIDFYYDESGHLAAVATPVSFVKFSYSGNILSKVIYPERQNYRSSNRQSIAYYYDNTFLIKKELEGLKSSLLVEYDNNKRVSAIGPIDKAGKDRSKLWSFDYQTAKTTVNAPFPIPQNIYYFNTSVHPSLPGKIVRPALQAQSTLDFNSDGLLTKRITPHGTTEIFEYDSKNPKRLFQANQVSERVFSNPKVYSDFSEKGIEYEYHTDIALPTAKTYYQCKNGKREVVKKEKLAYDNSDLTLSESTESGIKTRYWQNIYGESVISLNAKGTATISLYADTCKFPEYGFLDGNVNGKGWLCKKIVTDDARIVNKYLNDLGVDYRVSEKSAPVYQDEKYSYNIFGHIIRTQSELSDTFAVINLYGDTLYSYSLDSGITITQYEPWGKPKYILHQFSPADTKHFIGDNVYGIKGHFYRESFVYDEYTYLTEHYKTNEQFESGKTEEFCKRLKFNAFIYERYPSGKVKAITSPEGIKRVDERDQVTGLLKSQYIQSSDGKKTYLNSDFTYYPDGVIKTVVDGKGGMHQNLLDGFGEIYAEVSPLGVITQKQTNVLGQEIAKWSHKASKVLAKTENIYNRNNLLDTVKVYHYFKDTKPVIIEAKKFRYDEVGNIIAQRGIQENSWSYKLYDGLDREIVSKTPAGDIKITFYGRSLPYCEISVFKNQESGTTQRLGMFYEYDHCGRKIKETPITDSLKIASERAVEYSYDIVGNPVKTIYAGLSTLEKTFNTLGKVTSEKQNPHSSKSGETAVSTTYFYNRGGQLFKKEVSNTPLALVKTYNDKIIPERKEEASQITEYIFDSFARVTETIQPDGLVQEYVYNDYSLPTEMKWYDNFDKKTLRHLKMTYSVLGQCLAVADLQNGGKVIRRHEFDLLGNCVKSVDIDWQGKEVELIREFDSVGSKRTDSVRYDNIKFPVQEFSYDLPKGLIKKKWLNLQKNSSKYWQSETYRMDEAERLKELALDNKGPFATWMYMGNQSVRRTVEESGIVNTTKYNEFLEPAKLTIYRRFDKENLGELECGYGPQGQAEFSSAKLRDRHSDEWYEFASYSSFDSYRRLVAQNSQQILPDGRWQTEAENLLGKQPSDNNLGAWQTLRMNYDQANNIWAMYNGGFLLTPEQLTAQKKTPMFISPAAPTTLYKGGLQDMAKMELASNRDVTTAYWDADTQSLQCKEQKYDKLGCLTEYEGTYWNGYIRRPARWRLTYDALGRLVKMEGFALEDSQFDSIKKDDKLAVLRFSYDSENRRIRKDVEDLCSHKNRNISYTIYTGNHQSLVFAEKDSKISLQEQYLWNPGSQELLMAAMPENVAQNSDSPSVYRYYFQQDKGFNVIFTSRYAKSGFTTASAMSYLGFGENATRAEIKSIKSSVGDYGKNERYARDKKLQNNIIANWSTKYRKGIHHLELQLAGNDKLSALKIWTKDKFPKNFAVMVLPKNKDLKKTTSWDELLKKHKEELAAVVINGKLWNQHKTPDWENPYNIPLLDKQGDRIFILWDEACEVEVREFEVTKVPDNPGAIAFAGQWLDRETDMYYQINRYRLAGSNKFISPDPLGYFDGNNLYAYAHNNPLEWHDPDGRFAWHILAGAGIGAVLGGGMYALNCWMTGAEFSWAEFGVSVLAGAASGAIAAALLPIAGPVWAFAAAGAIGGAIAEGGITYIRTGDWEQSLIAAGKGAIWGGAAGAFAGGLGLIAGSSVGFLKTVAIGAFTGGVFGGARQGIDTYCQTGDWESAFYAAGKGTLRSAAQAAVASAVGYGVARLSQSILRYPSSTYNRPSGFRKGVKEEVWKSAIEPKTHNVRDPVTGRFMSKNKPWDMGHKPGHEWWKFRAHAKNFNLSRKQVLDWYNNPKHYRPELPSSNRCHAGENLTSEFFGAAEFGYKDMGVLNFAYGF